MTKRRKTEVLSVSLPKDLKRKITEYAKVNEISVSQFTREALRDYMAEDVLTTMQKELEPVFKELGIETYDDVEEYFG